MPNITNFFGLISDADPDDVPGGSSSAQKNVSTHSPGNLVPREGIQPITFSTTATISSSAFNTFQRMCFCRTRLGDLIGVNGLERGFRWDGITTNVEQLGITAPAAAPSIAAANLNTADKGKALTSPYVANNGSGLYRITSSSHGLSNGDKVVIGNVVGTGAMQGDLNGVKFTISGVTTHTFDLVGTIFDGTFTSGGTWSQECFGATEGIYTFA